MDKIVISLLAFIAVIIPLKKYNKSTFLLPITSIILIFLLDTLLFCDYKAKLLSVNNVYDLLNNYVALLFLVYNNLVTT